MPKIIVKQGLLFGNTYDLSLPKQTIGSGADDTIKINDSSVSEKNATIYCRADGSCFIDCKGEKGSVLINGKTVSMTKLKHGDLIRVGDLVFQYEHESGLPISNKDNHKGKTDSGHHLALEVLENYHGQKVKRGMDSSNRAALMVIGMFAGLIVIILLVLKLISMGMGPRESKEVTIRFEGDGIEIDGSRFNREKIGQLKPGNIKTEGVKIKNVNKGPKIQTGGHSQPSEKKSKKESEQQPQSPPSNAGGGKGISSSGQPGQGLNMQTGPGKSGSPSAPSQSQGQKGTNPKPSDSANEPVPMKMSQSNEKAMEGGGHLGDHMGDMGKKAVQDKDEPENDGVGDRMDKDNREKLRKLLGDDKGGGGNDPTAEPLESSPENKLAKAGCAVKANRLPLTSSNPPAIAMNQSGEFVVAWQSNQDILVRRFDGNGQVKGEPFRVNKMPCTKKGCPAIAMDNQGQILVVWISKLGQLPGQRVMTRRFDAQGVPWGPPEIVSHETLMDCGFPSVAIDKQGKGVVAYQAENPQNDNWQFVLQFLNPDGTKLGKPAYIDVADCDRFTKPTVTMTSDGQTILGWAGKCVTDRIQKIFAMAFDDHGRPLGSQMVLADGNLRNGCRLIKAGPGIFAWESNKGDPILTAMKFDDSGMILGREMALWKLDGKNKSFPMISYTNSDSYVQAWADYNPAKDIWEILTAKIDRNGQCYRTKKGKASI